VAKPAQKSENPAVLAGFRLSKKVFDNLRMKEQQAALSFDPSICCKMAIPGILCLESLILRPQIDSGSKFHLLLPPAKPADAD
jgi:hypothetical protein